MSKERDPKNVMTPIFRASFASVFVPKGIKGDDKAEKKYSVVMLFKNGEDLTALKKAATLAAHDKWGEKIDLKKIKKWPFKDQGDKAGEYEGFEEGCIYIQASSKSKPGLVNRNREDIIDEEEFYSGCYARATVTAFAWEHPMNGKGVSFGLNNIQKIKDGEALGGGPRVAAQDDFEDVGENVGSASDLFD